MPAQSERIIRTPRENSLAVLSERLRAAVESRANGARNAHGNGNGNGGAIRTPSDREVAIDVCRAILAEAGAGTAEHSDDVVLITEAIGQRMGFSDAEAGDLLVAARLHDIGKVWVPSAILEKSGSLTEEEWAVMRRHTVV